MKKYIILTPSICNIGGAEIYTRNKIKYLKNNDYDVKVISFKKGNILIKDLNTYRNSIIKELKMPSIYYSKKELKKIIDCIVEIINKDEITEVIIESHTIQLAFWGETVSQFIKAQHIVFLLSEKFNRISDEEYSFLNFKHQRKELVGISPHTIPMLFKEKKIIAHNENYSLKAICSNVVEDVYNPILDKIDKNDINIGCITRLEKVYVDTLIEEINVFAKKYNYMNKKIKLILLGGTDDKQVEEKIKDKVKRECEFEVVVTGYIFPIPKEIFNLINIFVGVSGAAKTSLNEGAITIALDTIDGKAIGVLGYDVDENQYRTTEQQTSLCEILEKIVIQKKIKKEDIIISDKMKYVDYNQEFRSHLNFIEQANKDKKYMLVKNKQLGTVTKIKICIFRVLGINRYTNLISRIQEALDLIKNR